MQLDDDLSDITDSNEDVNVNVPKSAQAPMAARRTLETLLERRALARRLRDDLEDDSNLDTIEW
ncbi:MAG: PA3496 family putative envelope integrity protein [Thioalkalivibrionaceae bacterium]